MRVLPILVSGLLVALAGCSDDGGADETDSLDAGTEAGTDGGTGGTGTGDAAPGSGPGSMPGQPEANGTEPVLETVPVQHEGSLGTYGFACETQSLGCHGTGLTGGDSMVGHEQEGATLVGVQLVIEWSAPTPATEKLGVRVSHAGSDFLHTAEGTSPLSLDLTGLDVPLGDDRLYVSVYNPGGIVSQPPLYAYVSVDQQFTLEGTLTLQSA